MKHIQALFKHLITGYVFKAKPSGLEPTPEDSRDFNLGVFHWFGYQPKRQSFIIPAIAIHNQGSRNTCVFESAIGAKEVDERIQLSVRAAVVWAKQNGLVKGDGISNLRSGQQVLQKFGAPRIGIVSEEFMGWSSWSQLNLRSVAADAGKHRTSSFWQANNRSEILKLLDSGRPVCTGTMWYTGFNQSGGFSSPWLITRAIGYRVMGHAFYICGYNMNYHGRQVYVCMNSYGKDWGDDGKFYVDMAYLEKNNYGFYTNLDDISADAGKIITQYDGKNVKGNDATIYHIQKGKKKAYLSWASYLSWGQLDKGFESVDAHLLAQVPRGDDMDIKKSPLWNQIKNLPQEKWEDAILTIINKK